MKTNSVIKFNSIEEYREIEKTLEELGYKNDKEWNESRLKRYKIGYIHIHNIYITILKRIILEDDLKYYNSLKEFLNG